MYDICIVAHVTRDVNTTPAGVKKLTGGAAYYLGMALQRLEANFLLITKLAPADSDLLQEMYGTEIRQCEATRSHFFENIYQDLSDNRQQKVHSLAEPFNLQDIAGVPSKVYHLGPLSSQDVSLEVIRELKKSGRVSLDAQGFLREVIGEEVYPALWPEMEEALPLIDILKVNDFEAQILTGEKDMRRAAIKLAEYDIEEVVITMGSRSSMVYHQGQLHDIPSFIPRQIVDATGCGDTYMAGYLFMRTQGVAIPESGRFGAALATLKMEGFGPFRGRLDDVHQLLDKVL